MRVGLTGGIGSGNSVVAELFGDRLVVDEGLMEKLRVRFQERGIRMAAINRNQAEIPEHATVLPNARGTAQGGGAPCGRRGERRD